MLNDILVPGQDWELVAEGLGFSEGTAANAAGEVFFQDIPNSKTYKVGLDGKVTILPIDAKKASGTSFGPDGKRYVAAGATRQILAYDAGEKVTVIADSLKGNDIVVANNGNIYITSPDGSERPGSLWLIRPNGQRVELDKGIRFPNGIALTPDQTHAYVTESASHWVWVYTIQPDGTLANKQRYGWLHVPDTEENAWPDGIKCDREGRVYVTSRIGIQVLDQIGRVNTILPLPSGQSSNCCFGGADFKTLYVSSNDKIYRRRLKVPGANAFQPTVKPPKPRL
jgi:sugar lactone lactonase YvrE